MKNPLYSIFIKRLKATEYYSRRDAPETLSRLDTPAIPALLEALTFREDFVRWMASEQLGKIGDIVAVPALIDALKDRDNYVRIIVATALGRIGDASAVPALIESIRDRDNPGWKYSVTALEQIGDSFTLPRKIIAVSGMTPLKRIQALNSLRDFLYKNSRLTTRYKIPDTRALCQTVMDEDDEAARFGARQLIDWLDGDSDLLQPSRRDTGIDVQELVRVVTYSSPEMQPETLLRSRYDVVNEADLR